MTKPKSFTLLPPSPDVCQECAVKHDPQEPHDQTSLFYQAKFFMEHHRYPTWADAMSHSPDEVKAVWIKELKQMGIFV